MSPNPFDQPAGAGGPMFSPQNQPVLQPAPPAADTAGGSAADMIRQKLDALYSEAPDSKTALQHIIQGNTSPAGDGTGGGTGGRSRHQQFMYDLGRSGRNLAQIQAAWHQYYTELPDDEKRAVWQEFYSTGGDKSAPTVLPAVLPAAPGHMMADPSLAGTQPMAPYAPTPTPMPPPSGPVDFGPLPAGLSNPLTATARQMNTMPPAPAPTAANYRYAGRPGHRRRRKLGLRHHLQSIGFGLTVGLVTIVVVMFSFFNEVLIAPFIQPSRQAGAVPIIIGADGITPTDKDEVIIPKINVEIPLDFSAQTTDEPTVDAGLNNGVIHYPTTPLPGQTGTTVFFGHSSNNIFNPGKYKFAFALLHELEAGDNFYITYKGVLYAYTAYDKRIIQPNDVSVLNNAPGKTATAALITCDPPGTSLHRLVVWGEQISPDPNGNTTAPPTPTKSGATQTLPDNGPTLWQRFWKYVTGHGS